MRDALEEADRVERGFGTRYVRVPRDETHEAYRDMEDFILTVGDERLRERLSDAIDGRGAFSRFKRSCPHTMTSGSAGSPSGTLGCGNGSWPGGRRKGSCRSP